MALKGSVFSVTQKQSVKVCPGKLQPSQYAPEHTCQNQKEKHCFVPLPSVQLFQPGGQKSVCLVTHTLRGPRTLTKRGIEQGPYYAQDPTEGELLGKQLLTKISYRIYHSLSLGMFCGRKAALARMLAGVTRKTGFVVRSV